MLYLLNKKIENMKATKKMIIEITNQALEMNFNPEMALKTLENCSASIYKTIGAKGLVNSSMRANKAIIANSKGGLSFNLCRVITTTKNAFLLVLPGLVNIEKWVAKSVIVDDIIPYWAVK